MVNFMQQYDMVQLSDLVDLKHKYKKAVHVRNSEQLCSSLQLFENN